MAGRKPKIVVIDDSEIVLEVTRGALEGAGYDVVTHDRPAGCVALIMHEKPELVLGFVRAIRKGIEYVKNNPKEKVAEIIVKKMGDPNAMQIVMNALDSVIVTEPRVDMPSTRILMQTIAKQGKIPEELVKDVDGWMAKYIDYSFLDKAEKSLGLAK